VSTASDLHPTESARPRSRGRRILVCAGLTIGLLLGVAVLVVRHYTSPERVLDLAERFVQQRVTGRVRIGSADLSLGGKLYLHDVVIGSSGPGARDAASGTPRRSDAVLVCPEIEFDYDPMSLLSGRLTIRSILAQGPVFTISRDEHGVSNITDLLLPTDDLDAFSAEDMPSVELRDARVRVVEHHGEAERIIEDIPLTVRAHRADQPGVVYDIVWTGRTPDEGGLSQIDMLTGVLSNVRGGLPWMSIEGVMNVVDVEYDGAGSWSRLLGLGGSVRAEDFLIGQRATPGRPRYVTISLRDATLSVPVSEAEYNLDRHEKYLSFERVNGAIRVTETALTADFAGVLHGAKCRVSATIRGGMESIRSLDDVSFDVEMAVDGYRFPEDAPQRDTPESRFIHRWPNLTKFFADYSPRGLANLDMKISKAAGAEGPIVVHRGRLTVVDGEAVCRFFPYRITDVTGVVEYSPAGIDIKDIRGRHGDGHVLVTGHCEPIQPGAEIVIRIVGTNIAIEPEVRSALPPRYQRILNHFEPTGTVNAEVVTSGPVYVREWRNAWKTKVDVSLEGVTAQYDNFPYPLTDVRGRILADEDGLKVRNVQGRRGDARVSIDGEAKFRNHNITAIDLSIVGEAVPFDDVLLAALPPLLRDQIAAFQAAGLFDVHARVGLDDAGEPAVTSRAFLRDVTVEPAVLPLEINGITGEVTVSADGIEFREVRGVRQGATFAVDGRYALAEGSSPTDIRLDVKAIEVTEEVLAALPPAVREATGAWRILGPVDVAARWAEPDNTEGHSDAAAGGALSASIRFQDSFLTHPGLPAPLEDVTGVLELTDDRIASEAVRASYAGAALTASLAIDRPRGAGHITATAGGIPLDHRLIDLAPPQLRDALAALRLDGVVDVEHAELSFAPEEPGGPAVWTVSDGRLHLRDVAVGGTIEMSDLRGQVTLDGAVRDRTGGLTLHGRLNLESGTFAGRPAEQIDAKFAAVRTRDGAGLLAIEELHAEVYGGSVMAEEISLRVEPDKTMYHVKAIARKIELAPLINPVADSKHIEDEIDAGGRLDAQLSLVGEVGRAGSRRGTGGFEVHDAYIYRLPVVFSILNFIDPTTPPSANAFNFARARFSIVGSRLDLEDVLLTGPAMTFSGAGTYYTADGHVNLDLEPKSRRSWTVPIVTPMVDGAASRIVGIQVVGPLSRPVVNAKSLPGVTDTLRDMFQRKKPSNYAASGDP
jgi:hypothetical protein